MAKICWLVSLESAFRVTRDIKYDTSYQYLYITQSCMLESLILMHILYILIRFVD